MVPTGNFGDILAGYFATRMGLPTDRLVIATNENDILHRFWRSGYYEKKPVHGTEAEGGFEEDGVKAHSEGVKETLAPAMDILVSSNFERLLWYLAFQTSGAEEINHRRMIAGEQVKKWLALLKSEGGFGVSKEILEAAQHNFSSERVSDKQTLDMITSIYGQELAADAQTKGSKATTGTVHNGHYILDPHSAIGIAASLRSISATAKDVDHISLATAHPAKFSHAVEQALKDVPTFSFETVLPEQFVGLEEKQRRVTECKNDWQAVRDIVVKEVEQELRGIR